MVGRVRTVERETRRFSAASKTSEGEISGDNEGGWAGGKRNNNFPDGRFTFHYSTWAAAGVDRSRRRRRTVLGPGGRACGVAAAERYGGWRVHAPVAPRQPRPIKVTRRRRVGVCVWIIYRGAARVNDFFFRPPARPSPLSKSIRYVLGRRRFHAGRRDDLPGIGTIRESENVVANTS